MAFDNLRLSFLLAGISISLHVQRRRLAKLRNHLSTMNAVIQLQTADGRVVRHFRFEGGRFFTSRKPHRQPDFVQVWRTAGDALVALLSPDRTDVVRAWEEERVQFKGSFRHAIYFAEVMTIVQTNGRVVA